MCEECIACYLCFSCILLNVLFIMLLKYKGDKNMCEECMKSYNFSFGTALCYMRDYKKKVSRAGWNGKGMYIYYVPTPEEKVSSEELVPEPYIALKTADDKIVPWTASQTDLLAYDWKLVD